MDFLAIRLWLAATIPASSDQIVVWGGIAVSAALGISAIIKAWNHLNDRWVSQKQYDKDIAELKKHFESSLEQSGADSARRDKLIAKIETLTIAIEKSHRR